MKAIFIGRQGVLVEGSGRACTLRCGAAAGLRMLTELDFRLIVIEDAPTVADDAAAHEQTVSRRDACRHEPDRPAVFAFPSGAGRLADNGRRRRRSDPESAACVTRHPNPCVDTPLYQGSGQGTLHQVDRNASRPASSGTALLDLEDAVEDGEGQRQTTAKHDDREDGIAVPDYATLQHALGHGEERVRWCAGKLLDAAGARTPLTPLTPLTQLTQWPPYDHTAMPAVRGVFDRLGDLLFREQLVLQGYYCCRHGLLPPAGASRPATAASPRCFCRPPQPGLLLQAAFDHGIDLKASWLVGATLDDVEAGNRAGCRTILIDNGSETVWRLGRGRVPTRIAPDLYGAARLMEEEGER